jgi:hypothetical protein
MHEEIRHMEASLEQLASEREGTSWNNIMAKHVDALDSILREIKQSLNETRKIIYEHMKELKKQQHRNVQCTREC